MNSARNHDETTSATNLPKVVVVGAGNWGRNLIRNHHALGSLAAIAEPNDVLRDAIKNDYPGVPLLRDFDEALATGHPLVLATPAPTHYPLAKRALEVGRDVFVEKPLTLAHQHALELIEIAERNACILMVGHLLLYQPAIRWIRKHLQTPEAGRVLHVHTQRTKLGKARSEENAWWSFAPHDVSVVLELLNHPPLEHAQASGHAMIQQGIHDNVHVDLQFATGQTAHLHVSWNWPMNERRTVVLTTTQMIHYDEVSGRVTVHHKGIHPNLTNRDDGTYEPDLPTEAPLELECRHFLDCITTRTNPRTDGRNGAAVVQILERAQETLDAKRHDALHRA